MNRTITWKVFSLHLVALRSAIGAGFAASCLVLAACDQQASSTNTKQSLPGPGMQDPTQTARDVKATVKGTVKGITDADARTQEAIDQIDPKAKPVLPQTDPNKPATNPK